MNEAKVKRNQKVVDLEQTIDKLDYYVTTMIAVLQSIETDGIPNDSIINGAALMGYDLIADLKTCQIQPGLTSGNQGVI